MHRYRNLMVGLARTATDAGLIRYALMVARLGTAKEIHFVHIVPGGSATPAQQDQDRVVGDLQAEVHSQLDGTLGAVQLSYQVLQGPLVDQLLVYAAEKHIDLLLVGHQPSHSSRKALARRLAMKAPCSVWMVPDGAPAALRRILVPIDFSEHAADTMRVATSMAHLSERAEVLALHVYFNEAVITYEEYDQVMRGEEEEAYRRFVAPLDTKGVDITPLFEESANIAETIVAAAQRQNADLIIMATRGRSRSAAILLGSVTEETILLTGLPLLVVKHFGAHLSVLQALLDRKFLFKSDLHTQ